MQETCAPPYIDKPCREARGHCSDDCIVMSFGAVSAVMSQSYCFQVPMLLLLRVSVVLLLGAHAAAWPRACNEWAARRKGDGSLKMVQLSAPLPKGTNQPPQGPWQPNKPTQSPCDQPDPPRGPQYDSTSQQPHTCTSVLAGWPSQCPEVQRRRAAAAALTLGAAAAWAPESSRTDTRSSSSMGS